MKHLLKLLVGAGFLAAIALLFAAASRRPRHSSAISKTLESEDHASLETATNAELKALDAMVAPGAPL